MKNLIVVAVLAFFFACQQKPLPVDQWQYIEVDDGRQKYGDFGEPEWLRYFGLDMQDVNRDEFQDILSGRYIYLNPGGDLTAEWQRIDLGLNVDGMLLINIDDDEFADAIGESLPDVYWLEATNQEATQWSATIIGQIPKTGHVNGQGYKVADVVKGGKPELLLTAHDGIYMAEIPQAPTADNWSFIRVVSTNSDEDFALADIDEDGDLDIVAGDTNDEGEPVKLAWYVNPGEGRTDWEKNPITETKHAIDRIRVGDFNADGINDIVIAEERYPGMEPDANLYFLQGKDEDGFKSWDKEILVTQYSMNNLDIGDIDRDGDMDIVTNEHKGQEYKTQFYLNDGNGNFTAKTIDTGKEMHLGAQLSDLDGDGDLDLVGHAWDKYQYLHVWRNDAIK